MRDWMKSGIVAECGYFSFLTSFDFIRENILVDKIKRETILEFQEAVNEEYGRDLSLEEATVILHGIANYFYVLQRINNRIAE